MDADAKRAAQVCAGLQAAGHHVVAITADTADLTRRVRELGAEAVVCDLDDPGRDALESLHALSRDEPRPVVLFTRCGEPDRIEAALEAGVAAYVVDGLSPGRVGSVIDVAVPRFRADQAVRKELGAARDALAARMLIDRAKLRLMEHRRVGEAEAYRHLRRTAMNQGRKIADVAAEILNTD